MSFQLNIFAFFNKKQRKHSSPNLSNTFTVWVCMYAHMQRMLCVCLPVPPPSVFHLSPCPWREELQRTHPYYWQTDETQNKNTRSLIIWLYSFNIHSSAFIFITKTQCIHIILRAKRLSSFTSLCDLFDTKKSACREDRDGTRTGEKAV